VKKYNEADVKKYIVKYPDANHKNKKTPNQ
jgi:hypothetical protein